MPAKVLIADDSLFMRTLLRRMLVPMGMEVIGEAENGQEAIERYRELKPDLLLLDITMPGLNGLDAAKRILDEDATACIVMCSALAATPRAQEAMAFGVRDLITKPFSEGDVRAKLDKVLAERAR